MTSDRGDSVRHSQPGRPRSCSNESSDVRRRLLDAALELFSHRSYQQVSTRQLASKADTNIAMIRYYFGNKAGLFEAMFAELYQPLLERITTLLSDKKVTSLESVMATYYQVIGRHPKLPRMVQQIMSLPEGQEQRQIITRVMLNSGALEQLEQALLPRLRPGTDPKLAKMSLMSMLVMPFLMPDGIRQLLELSLEKPFLDKLAKHNAMLLQQGLLMEAQG